MNERCPDHGEEEAPWMCECTRARLAALEREIDRTYKAWCGRDLMHLPLCEAIGRVIATPRKSDIDLIAEQCDEIDRRTGVSANAPHQARAVASRPEPACSPIGGTR